MQKTDRIFLLFLIIGIWGLIGTVWFKPNIVGAGPVVALPDSDLAETLSSSHDFVKSEHKHRTSDISKFKWKVRRIVEDCSVTDGEILC